MFTRTQKPVTGQLRKPIEQAVDDALMAAATSAEQILKTSGYNAPDKELHAIRKVDMSADPEFLALQRRGFATSDTGHLTHNGLARGRKLKRLAAAKK